MVFLVSLEEHTQIPEEGCLISLILVYESHYCTVSRLENLFGSPHGVLIHHPQQAENEYGFLITK